MAKSYMKYELPVWTINYLSVFHGWFGETPLPSTHRKVIKLINVRLVSGEMLRTGFPCVYVSMYVILKRETCT